MPPEKGGVYSRGEENLVLHSNIGWGLSACLTNVSYRHRLSSGGHLEPDASNAGAWLPKPVGSKVGRRCAP